MANNSIYGIRDYFSKLKTGLRTSHQFQLEIDRLGDLVVYASSATLPGRSLNSEPVPFFGFNFQVPTNTDYTHEWPITIRCDKDMIIYRRFKEWADEISSLANNTAGKKAQVPTDNARLYLLSSTLNDVTTTYKLIGIFPSNISDISFAHDNNGIATFDVTITLQYHFEDSQEVDPLQ